MSKPLMAGEASVWVQLNGPNTKPEYLGCHELGDLEEPKGDMTLLYCPDRTKAGKYVVTGSYIGEPGQPSTSVTTPLQKTQDYLERLVCPATLFVHKVTCGRRDLFQNWDRTFALHRSIVTSQGASNLASRNPGAEDESTQSFEISAETVLRYLAMTSARQSIAETEDLRDIAFCNVQQCASECGPAMDACQYGVIVANALAGSALAEANVYITEDGGATWTVTAGQPFGGSEDIASVVCFAMDRNITRILVARGTTDPAAPAEVAYSDDDGATWTNVNVGATNGQYVPGEGGLFALDQWHIWLVTDDGYIYFSEDAGLTWVAQEEGVINVAEWYAIEFADYETGYVVGDSNEIAISQDGGASWTAVAGPAAQAGVDVLALEVIDANNVWIGYDDGELWYTRDGGATWAQRNLPIALAEITSIAFAHPLAGFLVGNKVTGLGVMLRTIDGGYTWQEVALPTNDGLAAVWACDINTAFTVGAEYGGTGMVVKAFPE